MQQIAEGIVVSKQFRYLTVSAIATGKGLVCIDVPPLPRDAQLWRAKLEERFHEPVRLVILTDAHRDRLLGLHWYADARLLAHDATYQIMRNLPSAYIDQAADMLSTHSQERTSFAGVRMRLPSVTFSDKMTAYVDDVPIPLVAMPGPTTGNIWVHLPAQEIVFTGDSVTVGIHPYMAQAQSKDWLNSLSQLRRARFAANQVVSGRSGVTTKEATQELSEFLRYARRRVQRLYKAERPRADVINLVSSLVEQFPIPHGEQEDVQRRVKLGLESIFDEFRLEDESAQQNEGQSDE